MFRASQCQNVSFNSAGVRNAWGQQNRISTLWRCFRFYNACRAGWQAQQHLSQRICGDQGFSRSANSHQRFEYAFAHAQHPCCWPLSRVPAFGTASWSGMPQEAWQSSPFAFLLLSQPLLPTSAARSIADPTPLQIHGAVLAHTLMTLVPQY